MFLPRPNAPVQPFKEVLLLNRPVLAQTSIISTSRSLQERRPRQSLSNVVTTTTQSMTQQPLDLLRLRFKIWRSLQMTLLLIQASPLTLSDLEHEQLYFLWLSSFSQEVLELYQTQLPFRLLDLLPLSLRWVQYPSTTLAAMSSILSQMILYFQQPLFGHIKEAA